MPASRDALFDELVDDEDEDELELELELDELDDELELDRLLRFRLLRLPSSWSLFAAEAAEEGCFSST